MPTNDRAVVRTGMAVWAVLWGLSLVFRSRLAEAGNGWWICTPPAAIALGLFGLHYLRGRELRHAGSA
ncbi:MAG TPA: hypothetical protein VHN80_11890, partial [Kineosporiaceae bacterium]|nr:hypothetical protein [Kineosporiaceae bacterium]